MTFALRHWLARLEQLFVRISDDQPLLCRCADCAAAFGCD